jgi:hypothetical protein
MSASTLRGSHPNTKTTCTETPPFCVPFVRREREGGGRERERAEVTAGGKKNCIMTASSFRVFTEYYQDGPIK